METLIPPPATDVSINLGQGRRQVLSGRHTRTMIWVTFSKVGMHNYPAAPDEVSYLRDLHRHLFKFKVGIQTHHADREIEFHMFLNWVTSLFDTNVLKLDYKSCEMLAEDLIDNILAKYNCSNRQIEVTVSEDEECGATVYSNPEGVEQER